MAGLPTAYTLLSYVWSDIFDARIDYAGYHSNYEARVVRGARQEKQLIQSPAARPGRVQSDHQVGNTRFARSGVRSRDRTDAVA
jgi:Reductase C-terminal